MSKNVAKKKQPTHRTPVRRPAELSRPATPSPATSSAGAESANRWTFLTNHTHVLAVLHSDPQIVLRKVALDVGITERAVQRIIQDLEDGGFIRRERVGRQNRYEVLTNQSLRHPIEAHRNIGDLLRLICRRSVE